jgi:hypothetical protein
MAGDGATTSKHCLGTILYLNAARVRLISGDLFVDVLVGRGADGMLPFIFLDLDLCGLGGAALIRIPGKRGCAEDDFNRGANGC